MPEFMVAEDINKIIFTSIIVGCVFFGIQYIKHKHTVFVDFINLHDNLLAFTIGFVKAALFVFSTFAIVKASLSEHPSETLPGVLLVCGGLYALFISSLGVILNLTLIRKALIKPINNAKSVEDFGFMNYSKKD